MQNGDLEFLGLLSAYINKSELNIEDYKDTDWERIFQLAKIHSVGGMIFAVVSKYGLNVPDEILNQLRAVFLKTTAYTVNMERQAAALLELLNENGIWHLVSKGYLIKSMYPDKQLRTMGDTDILVKKESLNNALELLKANGYELTGTYYNEVSFRKNNANFELHDSMLEEDMDNNIDYGAYFDNLCFTRALEINGFTHKLNVDDHLLYLFAHIGKHFYNEGCGVRMIMDIAVYLNYCRAELNWDYLWAELEKIRLKRFAQNIINLCKRWFAVEIDVPEMSEALYNEITSYVLEGGTFGFFERNAGTKVLRKSYGKGNRGSFMAWIFPSLEDMRQLSMWFKDKPAYLLPVAWVKRWVDALIKKRGAIIEKALGAVSSKEEAKYQYELLKELGIHQDS